MRRNKRPSNGMTRLDVAPRWYRRQGHLMTWDFLLVRFLTPLGAQSYSMAELPGCWTHCAGNFSGIEKIPGMGCRLYQVCFQGKVKQRVACGEGLLYNIDTGYCDYTWLVDCTEPTCPPTLSPSESPTESPSDSPTAVSFIKKRAGCSDLVCKFFHAAHVLLLLILHLTANSHQLRGQRSLQQKIQLTVP
jgi:hypothetical protein